MIARMWIRLFVALALALVVGNTSSCGDDDVAASSGGSSSAPDESSSSSLTTTDATEDGSDTRGPERTGWCGDGLVDPGEECDDGNRLDGDGCNARCEVTMQTAVAIAAGGCTCAILSEGRLRCWGSADCHGWGSGEQWLWGIGFNEPPAAAGDLRLDAGVVDVSLSPVLWGCIVTDLATVRCWGGFSWPYQGEWGYDPSILLDWDPRDLAAAPDVDVGAPVERIVLGNSRHVCAIVSGGRLRCWGRNAEGQLGYGHTDNIGDDPGETPAVAGDVDVGGTVTDVVIGDIHTCALIEGGDVRCWGSGEAGVLGSGNLETIGDDEVPASVPPVSLPAPAVAIVSLGARTCAVLEDHTLSCWGKGVEWLNDREDIGDDETPADVARVDTGGPVLDLAGMFEALCLVLADGDVKCWGAKYLGLESLRSGQHPADLDALPLDGPAVQVSMSYDHVCVLLADHRIRCWGSGWLGYPGISKIDLDRAGDVPYE